MKVETLLGGSAALAAMLAMMHAPVTTHAAGSANAPAGKNSALTLESVPGSSVKRIRLTEKAIQRLGIATGKVTEEPIHLKQVVGGLVVAGARPTAPDPATGGGSRDVFGGFEPVSMASPAPATHAPAAVPPHKGGDSGETLVEVALSRTEWERLAKDQPARLMPLATRDKAASEITARPSGMRPLEDAKRSMLKAYYVIAGNSHGLQPNKRVRVELAVAGSDDKRKVVPYSAVYYDAKGEPWVYLSPEPLVFQRQQIRVERIVGDLAVLTDGPAVGTTVVTVGAPLLYGTEIFKK